MPERKGKSRGKKSGQPDDPMEGEGLLLQWIETGIDGLAKTSLGRLLEKIQPKFLDLYILGWFILQVVIFLVVALSEPGNTIKLVIIGIFTYRLFEILIVNFDSVFVRVMRGKSHHSVPRLFSLILANYVEVILIFGVMFSLIIENATIAQALNYSVSLATLSGLSFDNPTTALYVAGIFEMILGVFFVTGAIAAIANYLGSKE